MDEQKKENMEMNEANSAPTEAAPMEKMETTMGSSESMGVNETPSVAPKSRLSLYAAIIIIIAVVAGGAWWYFDRSNMMDDSGSDADMMTADDYPAVVATVNGVDLSRDDFMDSLNQTKQLAAAQGANPDDLVVQSQIKEQALTVLINSQLLLQAAQASGMTVTDADIDAQVATLESQYGGKDGLAEQMKNANMDENKLRSNLREQLLIDGYIKASDEYNAVSVDDTEVKAAYDAAAAQGQDLPAFEDVSDQIKQNLLAQKQQQAVNTLINRLTSEATIKKFI